MTPKIEMQPNDGTLVTLLGIVRVVLHFNDFAGQIEKKLPYGDYGLPIDGSFLPDSASVYITEDPDSLSDVQRNAILSWTDHKTGLPAHLVTIRKAAA